MYYIIKLTKLFLPAKKNITFIELAIKSVFLIDAYLVDY
jgi:hypothetical protein